MLAFANIFGNLIQVTIFAFYFGPSCILQDFLFSGGTDNFLTGFVAYLSYGQWNQDLLIHDVTSFDRLITVVYPKAAFLFSRRATIGMITFVYVFGYFISWFANYYLPCCKFYPYYGSFSYMILDSDYNTADVFVVTPINFITSSIAVVNYIIIYFYIHISNRHLTQVMDVSIQQTRRIQEIKFVFQFALCTVCCIMTWISFRIFAAIGISPSPLYIILTTLQIIHSTMNSIVFLIFNKDIRQEFRRHIQKSQST